MRPSLFTAVAMQIVLLCPLFSVGRQAAEEITKQKILAAGQEWRDKYDNYEPASEMVDVLKAKLGADLRIDVYVGLWCPDSRRNVPQFIKIMDRAGAGLPIRYFAVPRKASTQVKYYVEEMKVERVPTFIVYRDGIEIGRIIENPRAGMLEDLMDILFK